MDVERWENRYREGNLPWDTGTPDEHLIDIVARHPIPPGRALEIGCGTGTNAIWLATQGFRVTALDISTEATAQARAKAKAAGAHCAFVACDFVRNPPEQDNFAFAFDRGCLHSFDAAWDRARFASNLAALMADDGLWLSLIGSTDGPPRDSGPPRRSALDVVAAIEPHFEILRLDAIFLRKDIDNPAQAWLCLSRKRREYAD
ncbi:methyltransferase domain-containing protein [Candidatus Sumerlaeota bacterium]|nr:methyltransferase domain-containing protein [Candidatus Sumerlaeota bacterium]